jgi:hypothetical protein
MGQEDQSREGRLIFMPHSRVSCLVHLVFSTSRRQPTMREQMRDRLHAYLGGIARETAMVAIAVGGVADIQPSLTGRVHALFATQHCVLGYYQAVPAGLYATNSCRNSGAGKECTSYRTAVGAIPAHDSAVSLRPGVPWGKARQM